MLATSIATQVTPAPFSPSAERRLYRVMVPSGNIIVRAAAHQDARERVERRGHRALAVFDL